MYFAELIFSKDEVHKMAEANKAFAKYRFQQIKSFCLKFQNLSWQQCNASSLTSQSITKFFLINKWREIHLNSRNQNSFQSKVFFLFDSVSIENFSIRLWINFATRNQLFCVAK
eukprot:TRINITY_DN1558_c2_g2_i2.p1 TRINITY_DN1558_c2_g2~~TRINITY_DN1558_c2_g2_i2.p1  ORF type:complete len:123 (+),score=0.05 TRINITY_DN1558_c2_g2_i2:29-370(+)